MKNAIYLVALNRVDGLGPIRLKKLLDYFGDPKNIWDAKLSELKNLRLPENVLANLQKIKNEIDPEKYFDEIKKSGVNIITIFDEDYPNSLKNIYDPPTVLFFKGNLEKDLKKTIGVVGTRKITTYGKIVTEDFTKGLVEAGFVIISGLARGVDTIAHSVAVKNSGQTIAVLGGGINKIFPAENISLAQKIANGFGAVVSEFPPDYPSLPGNFPSRNRIIAAFSQAVLVTEAAEDSGSLITARLALDFGKEVFAIPGPITSSLSLGPANLIKQGAKLTTSVDEILEDLGVERVMSKELRVRSEENLSKDEKVILEILDLEQKHIDEICRDLNLNVALVSASLVKMEIKGLVKNLGGGIYFRV